MQPSFLAIQKVSSSFSGLFRLLFLTAAGLISQSAQGGYETAFRLTSASYSAAEGGTITGTVERYSVFTTCSSSCDWDIAAAKSACLNLSPSGTYPIVVADLAANWQDGRHCVTIPAWSYSTTFTIPFNQNTNLQYDRTATLTVDSIDDDAQWTRTASVTLQDDDNGIYAYVYQGGTNYVSMDRVEGATSGQNSTTFRIWRGTGLVQGRTIGYTISGSATSGSDYTVSPSFTGSVTIPQGSDHADFTITALPDSVQENSETLTLTLNSGIYQIASGPATVNILDDTPAVSVWFLNPNAAEGGSQIGMVVQRNLAYGASSSRTVNLSIGGSATPSVDYTPTLPASVVIPAGQIYVTNWVTPLADSIVEGVETITATVLAGNYYVVDSAGGNATAYINNNNYPVVTVETTDAHAGEGGGTGVFTISRSGNVEALTVQFDITGTATPGTDYTALPSSVTLPSGIMATNIVVSPIINAGTEAAETIVLSLKTNASYFLGLQTSAVVTITGDGANPRDAYPKAVRYMRGSGTNLAAYTMVVPLDGLKGTRRPDMDFFGYNDAYHFNATNAGNQLYPSNRIAFNTPIVSFGSTWGSPLYLEESYTLGIYQGVQTGDPIQIYAFRKSDGGMQGLVNLELPYLGDSGDWSNFVTNGFARTVSSNGLTTVLRCAPDMEWGVPGSTGWLLTHTASDEATNYTYLITGVGWYNGQFMNLTSTGQGTYGFLYELGFEPRPAWRSVFLDQPHFQGDPLPPHLWNKTPDELFKYGVAVTNSISLIPSNCLTLDSSPELRRHPILDQFVADLNNDPIALANYVQNEIGLTDAIAYRDDGSVATESVNQGGVNRAALGVYLEGQGSPVEQCALLVYFLRQAGYPTTYVFPPDGGLKLLDTRVSSLLRTRINGGQDDQGRLYTTNQLIAVNYPWVATYISNQWVHIFPWIKDTAAVEGLDVYDFLPNPYKDTQLWVKDYVLGRTNILAFATANDDTPGTIFPRWLDAALKQSAPGVSLDDLGMRYLNRRHLYSQWSDFPRPTWVTNTSIAVESLASSGVTNVSPALTNIFDSIQVELYSLNNPQKFITTPVLRVADLHNRKFYLTHTNIGGGQIQAQLVLGAYRPGSTSSGNFSDATLTNRQVLTLNLDNTDDNLKIRFRHHRQRALKWETALDPDRGFLDLWVQRQVLAERPLRKGDVGAICFDAGRVTPAMLRVHAQELWNMEQMISTNSAATNQVSVDVYQGSLVYLMGMSYYERTARFDSTFRNLFKVQDLSSFAMGLAKISPRRNPDGTLYNGTVDPVWPNVDMFFQEIAMVGNGTARLDSGWDSRAAIRNYFNLSIADLSAQEHATLNVFYGQSNAVSTVKLLQLAQKNAAIGGSNVVELTVHNYASAGNVVYGTAPLKDHDPALWSQIAKFFEQPGTLGYVVGWMPPGPVTNASGSFSGMGAFILGVDRFAALIGNNQYGAYGDRFGYNNIAAPNTPNYLLDLSRGDFTLSLSSPTPSSWASAPASSSTFNYLSDFGSLSSGALRADPFQNLSGMLSGYLYNNTSGSYVNNYTTTLDVGGFGKSNSWDSGGGFQKIMDPVHALTGEFYIDEVDLSLPGPMPLQIRRNYGSQNLSANQLGYGWKLNYMPYLTVAPTNDVIYAAELDGSVLAFGLVSNNQWAPTLALNPTLNNHIENGIGSVANYLNARLAKAAVGATNYYYLTNGDGAFRVFQEMSFPLTNSVAWDRLRPYLTSWHDNRGNFYRFEYGTNPTAADYGQVRRIISSSGNIVRFVYDVSARIVEAYSLDGRRVQYTFDDYGDLATVTRPDGSAINYEYQIASWSTNSITNFYSTHLITKELKPDGRVLQNAYDDQRRVTNQWATVGPDLRLVRNATFLFTNNFSLTNLTGTISGTTTILDYTNNPTTYFYTNGLIRRIRDPLGAELVQDWYEAFETNAPAYPRSLKTVRDKRGLVTDYLYDTRGNATNTTVKGDLIGDGNTNTVAVSIAVYNTNNLPTLTVDTSGTTNQIFYTNTWLPARVEVWPLNATPAQAITNLYFYATVTNGVDGTVSHGLRVREIRAAYSPDAATNDWAFNSRGFPTLQVRWPGTGDPAVIVTNFPNYRGELVLQTDAAGHSVRIGNDPMGRPQSREVFDTGGLAPVAWDFTYYNDNGEVTWTDGPRFNPEDYVWRDHDGAGRPTQEIRWRSRGKSDGSGVEAETGDNLYATSFNEYDPLNRLVKATDPLGNYSHKKHDVVGQVIREEFYNAANVLLATNGFRYNAAGDVTNAFNALGGLTETQHTSTGKPKFQRNPDGSTNAWRFYADGRLRREIQRNGAYWETTYNDALRRITRVFYSATGVPLATNISELDRRGNVIKRTDAGGFVFTSLFDGLNRVKISAGPPIVTVKEECGPVPNCGNWVTNILQQSFTNYFDAAGVWQTNINVLGERTITRADALQRNIRTEIRAANNSLVRETSTTYFTNHHGLTVTQGSGGSAIASTTFTGNDGQTVLDIRYPAPGYLEYTWNQFDRAGRRLESQQLSRAGTGSPYLWSYGQLAYDGLNRVIVETNRDHAVRTYGRDALGNVTNRTMPGGLEWNALHNNAGQMLKEWNIGTDGAGTRTNTYAYYPAGHPFAGLLHTRTEPRGYVSTSTYDAWLELATLAMTTADPYTTLTTTWDRDTRGCVTNITELDAGAPTGANPRVILRTVDAYRQITSESISLNGVALSSAGLTWDAAGRRSLLSFNMAPNFAQYGFGWQADGGLASVSGPAGSGTYSRDTAGIMTSRSFSGRTVTIAQRDGTGRPLQVDTDIYGTYVLQDELSWFLSGQLATHTISRWDYTDTRNYAYTPYSRRLSQEQLNLTDSQRWTNNFTHDGGIGGGIGVLTKIAATPTSPRWSGTVDSFSRVQYETNTVLRRPAYGTVNGAATLTATLDGQALGVGTAGTNGGYWRTLMSLTPGAHQLVVSAKHPSGLFTTNAASWFTNTATGADRIEDLHNNAGMVRRRIWRKADGTTNRTQILYWDAKDRLYQVIDYDQQQNGYGWNAIYDGLDRRLRTQTYLMTNGMPLSPNLPRKTIQSYYDPLVEFLELGVNDDGQTTWKAYGPDLNGAYGGMQGVGGLEAVQRGLSYPVVLINDALGNVHQEYNTANGNLTWSSARHTAYGAVPGREPVALGYGGSFSDTFAWRGKWKDVTGYYWIGKRFYDPEAGRWLSYDPMWNSGDANGYTFCAGDPLNAFDPDGRFAIQQVENIYNGGIGGNALRSLGGYLENYQTDNPLMAMLTGGAGSLSSTLGGMITPASYVNSASHFGSTVSTLYKEDGFGVAASYATTSWNVGAFWSGAANINLATGEPVGDWYQRSALMSSGVAGTAGVASGGLGLYNWATAAPKPPVVPTDVPPVIPSPGQPVYGALDNLGRPTGAYATIDQSVIGTGTRASQSITPPGYVVDSGFARGHLIGRQLGGSGNEAGNLVTMFQNPANHPVMSGIEGQVRAAVQAGQTVNYSVVPIYQGGNAIPSGVTIMGQGSGGFNVGVTVLNRGR